MANRSALTVLFLAANPTGSSLSRLEQEARDISEGLLRARHRDMFRFEQRWAVRSRGVRQALLDCSPQIVHFAGTRESDNSELDHNTPENNRGDDTAAGLAFEYEKGQVKQVSAKALASLFELFSDKVNCVLLNGGHTANQAEAIARHIPYVIGTKQSITSSVALTFALGFYDALGAGNSVDFSYELGCVAMRMEGLSEHMMPVLYKQSDQALESASDSVTDYMPSSEPTHHKNSNRRLKEKREDLEGEYQDIRKKLNFLKKELVIKNDVEAKYELSQRVEQYEVKLRDIENMLEALEYQIVE